MHDFVSRSGLCISAQLFDFIEQEVLPGVEISSAEFWSGLASVISRFAPINRDLMVARRNFEKVIDDYHRSRIGTPLDIEEYKSFLRRIGYLVDEHRYAAIRTSDVDDEIASIAGPQLVVPLTNARYVLNAVNARWYSIYDALYGSDIGFPAGSLETTPSSNSRAKAVVEYVRQLLDEFVPLLNASHRDVLKYALKDGVLCAKLENGKTTSLLDGSQFAGFQGEAGAPAAFLFCHNGLHIELSIDSQGTVGSNDRASVNDVLFESAITTIVDLEDSVATVDAEDKVAAYRNLLQLQKGTLTAEFEKGGRTVTRQLNPDRVYRTASEQTLVRSGRGLLLVRNVGHHIETGCILDPSGGPIPEEILDISVAALIALHDRKKPVASRNSRAGAIYIVKPKIHGPDEAEFVDQLFAATEDLVRLPRHTIKIGLMDEERRTTLNLPACIHAIADRIFFINTGFLDRTGDEIRTSTEAGIMLRKNDMKSEAWLKAYENWNVEVGLNCGLPGRAQIGKGMWAAPDKMADMLEQKLAHPFAGASTAWVPSPTAAAIHAIHYHRVDVASRQVARRSRPEAQFDDLLQIPVMQGALSADEIQQELDSNVQSLLGYVVHWIDRGIGCSKIPDINNVGLMEDRATLRISSQHIANWLRHGIVTGDQVLRSLKKMAAVIDAQNAGDKDYRPIQSSYDGPAFRAACELALEGGSQPNGYTEWILYKWRRQAKRAVRRASRSNCKNPPACS